MMIIAAFLAVGSLVGLTLLIRRTLRQRPEARKFRSIFISVAEDLIGKPEFPEAHARHLIVMSSSREGWLTRFMVAAMLKEIITGQPLRRSADALSLDLVPANLRAKYAVAILTFAMSDSYHCAIFGRIWRGANSWISEAITDVKPDVDAHATRSVVARVNHAHPPRHSHPTGALATI
jgi:hypothetical protein